MSQGKTHNLRLSVVSLAGLDLSTGSEAGQESVILIFLDLLFGQSAASSLGGFGLLGGDLFEFCVSIVRESLEKGYFKRSQTYLCLGVVSLAGLDLSTGSEAGQESVVLILLDLLFGQGTASSLSGFGFLSSNLMRIDVSIPFTLDREVSSDPPPSTNVEIVKIYGRKWKVCHENRGAYLGFCVMRLTILDRTSSFGRLGLLCCDLSFSVVAGLDDNITGTLCSLCFLGLLDIRTILNLYRCKRTCSNLCFCVMASLKGVDRAGQLLRLGRNGKGIGQWGRDQEAEGENL